MTDNNYLDKGTLILAFITGLSLNGSLSALFNSLVAFSVFPLLSLALAVWSLHQRYLNCLMPEGMPSLAASFFLLGILVYSAIVRVVYPEIGANFIPVLLMVVVVFWIAVKIKKSVSRVP
ncbi:YijD family membrane protein [Enterobacteriaceae bacterium LUAb1]